MSAQVKDSTEKPTDSDLDKAVALAFGFKPAITWAIFNADETALMIDFERKAEAVKWWDEHPSVHAEHHIGEMEHYEPYSANIEAAMRVVEKMRELSFGWTFCTHRDGWFVRCFPLPDEGRDLASQSVVNGSLATAICIAALKALESKDGNRKS